MFDHDFTEVVYTLKYFCFGDIMSKIGGIVASLHPVVHIKILSFALVYELPMYI